MPDAPQSHGGTEKRKRENSLSSLCLRDSVAASISSGGDLGSLLHGPIHPHGQRNAFELARTQLFMAYLGGIDRVERGLGEIDVARLGQGLNSGGHVHGGAEDVAVVEGH